MADSRGGGPGTGPACARARVVGGTSLARHSCEIGSRRISPKPRFYRDFSETPILQGSGAGAERLAPSTCRRRRRVVGNGVLEPAKNGFSREKIGFLCGSPTLAGRREREFFSGEKNRFPDQENRFPDQKNPTWFSEQGRSNARAPTTSRGNGGPSRRSESEGPSRRVRVGESESEGPSRRARVPSGPERTRLCQPILSHASGERRR